MCRSLRVGHSELRSLRVAGGDELREGGIHFLTSNFEPYPFLEWRPKIVEPRGEARAEWDIFKRLSRAAGVPFLNDPLLDKLARNADALGVGFSEDLLYRYLLAGKMRLGRLKRKQHGVQVGDIQWGEFLRRGIRSPHGRIELAPDDLVAALVDAVAAPPLPSERFPMLLISGARRLASYNSWTHNIPALMEKMKGNWLTLAPEDAARLGIDDGTVVRVESTTGVVEIPAMISADIRAGVVAIHQFWGHKYESGTRTSRRYPGVKVNFLHDDRVRDRFCGMPVYNGTPCHVARVGVTRAAATRTAR